MVDIRYVDLRGLREVWPVSKATIFRAMKPGSDPFPGGKIIGRKRFWILGDILDWLARQDDVPHQVKAA